MKSLKIKEKMLDYLFPKQCIYCSKFGKYICNNCRKLLRPRKIQQCHVCKKGLKSGFLHEKCRSKTNIEKIIVCINYSKAVEKLVAEYKYNLFFDLQSTISKYYLRQFARFIDQNPVSEVIFVPVPLHKKRQNARGFNQSELLAQTLARSFGFECCNLLTRNVNTSHQVGKSRAGRLKNLKNAFDLNYAEPLKKFINYEIFLVDDVTTTGTTLEECAGALKKFGFSNINAIVLARG